MVAVLFVSSKVFSAIFGCDVTDVTVPWRSFVVALRFSVVLVELRQRQARQILIPRTQQPSIVKLPVEIVALLLRLKAKGSYDMTRLDT